ncbi:CDP-alcohol phosphatidyltransferase family protein [Moorella sulfitireducens]|uniref:CDP-alcohol phosphatidyltransferase family protein n=1 Tax=Neomoorella sulfitireducens TaxID=2972948 RepID=UPI0021ACB93C|nr:CDP-alcohol phosphatidyltransferase family protein [Moorella sulfitireducens]
MSYPYMPFDDDRIRQLRVKLQKPYVAESLEAWLIHRRISIYATLMLNHIGWITPNIITASAILIASIGIVIIWLINPGKSIVVGLGLYQLAYLLDVIDGELARIRNQASARGLWLDKILEGTMNGLALAVGIKAAELSQPLWASGFLLTLFIVRMVSRNGFVLTSRQLRNKFPTTELRVRNPFINVISFFSSSSGWLLLLVVGYLLDRLSLFWLLGVGLFASSTLYQLHLFWNSLLENEDIE